ncbi:hypothetical protein, partial [Laceyella tengchongensis]|uniref:hypothetical protein n=1 Tax=Laceyella tengchongensis TaxID=574699 RepID=UPI001E4567CB
VKRMRKWFWSRWPIHQTRLEDRLVASVTFSCFSDRADGKQFTELSINGRVPCTGATLKRTHQPKF